MVYLTGASLTRLSWKKLLNGCSSSSSGVSNWLVGCWNGYLIWGEVQICIWPSWCHCHSLSLAPVNPDWFYLPGTNSPG